MWLVRKDKTVAKGKALTLKDVVKIEELLQAGMSVEAVARIIKISPISVSRIKKGEHTLQIREKKGNELVCIYRVLNEIKDGINSIAKELGVKPTNGGVER